MSSRWSTPASAELEVLALVGRGREPSATRAVGEERTTRTVQDQSLSHGDRDAKRTDEHQEAEIRPLSRSKQASAEMMSFREGSCEFRRTQAPPTAHGHVARVSRARAGGRARRQRAPVRDQRGAIATRSRARRSSTRPRTSSAADQRGAALLTAGHERGIAPISRYMGVGADSAGNSPSRRASSSKPKGL